MKLKNAAILGQGQTRAKISQDELTEIRRHVISGDWSAINAGVCTLADLGLRHSGGGLVWLRSGESVRDADSDTGFVGKTKVSHEYHSGVCPAKPADDEAFSRGVHAHKVDGYCLLILTRSQTWVEYWHRNDGKALSTFAVQVLANERQDAFDGWVIYRHPTKTDKYTVIHEERDSELINEYVRRGWKCESTYELSLLIKNDSEFSRLMGRLGYIKVRTRKITGRKESFWVYRSAEKGLAAADKQPKIDTNYAAVVRRISRGKQEVCPQEHAPRKASRATVQTSETERFVFTRVAVDGRYLWVYDDHIRYLKKIRTRIGGKQVQGYTAKNAKLLVEGVAKSSVSVRYMKNKDVLPAMQSASTKYTPAQLASMTPAEILAAAKDTLIAVNGKSGVGMVAHSIMLKHGGRNLASVPQANLAECLADLDKLLNLAQMEVAA